MTNLPNSLISDLDDAVVSAEIADARIASGLVDERFPTDPLDYAEDHRDKLGRRVREVWVLWAQRQPNPKPSWLVPYDELSEADKEADRCIGSALWGDGFADGTDAAYAAMDALGFKAQ